jgi:hypothetical protein
MKGKLALKRKILIGNGILNKSITAVALTVSL